MTLLFYKPTQNLGYMQLVTCVMYGLNILGQFPITDEHEAQILLKTQISVPIVSKHAMMHDADSADFIEK